MKNKNGFTLVELLAMLVVLGVLIAVAIPNMSGIIKDQKTNILKTDARSLVERAKAKAEKENLKKPKTGECYIFTLDYLNDNESFEKGPNDGTYYKYDSFVLYTKKYDADSGSYKLKYYVRLVEQTSSGNYGYDLEDIENITETKSDNIVKVSNIFGLTSNKNDSASRLNNQNSIKAKCNVTAYPIVFEKYFIHYTY